MFLEKNIQIQRQMKRTVLPISSKNFPAGCIIVYVKTAPKSIREKGILTVKK